METCQKPPCTVYHGTDACFEIFDLDRCFGAHFGTRKSAIDRLRSTGRLRIEFQSYSNDGEWWVREMTYSTKPPFEHGPFPDEEAAESFIALAPSLREPLAFEIDVYRPLVLPDLGTWTFQDVANHLGLHMREKFGIAIEDAWNAWNRSDQEGWRVLKKVIRNAGFDCVAYKNETEDVGSISWIVLHSDRIHAKWKPGQADRAQVCGNDHETADPDADIDEDARMQHLAREYERG